MECDIILDIGGKTPWEIKRTESKEDLNTLEKIVLYINKLPDVKKRDLLNKIWTSKTRVNNSLTFFKDRLIIGNCTITNLMKRFPEETEGFLEMLQSKPYVITLIDKAYTNGHELRGRTVVNGLVTYVLRNKFDVLNFVNTEQKKYMATKVIKDNDILDEYLKSKYEDKLKIIRDTYKNNLERVSKESVNSEIKPSEFTINLLILDYLNNKDSYDKLIKNKDLIIDAGSVLNDFCRELNKLLVFNEDTESDLARTLRRLHYKREEFGKKELYEVLSKYFPNFKRNYPELKFVELNKDALEAVVSEYFKDDIILKNYHVESVSTTELEEIHLTKSQIEKLFETALSEYNKKRKANNEPELKGTYKELINTVDDALIIFENNLFFEKNKEKYKLSIKTNADNDLIFYYEAKVLKNNDKIFFKRVGKTLGEEFNFGYEQTQKVFLPVNEDDVKDGKYYGYYIYEHLGEDKKPLYIISQSVIYPDLYNPPKFGSLKDAKLAVLGFNRSASLEKAAHISIKLQIRNVDGDRKVLILHKVNTNLAIESLDYPIKPKLKLLTLEYNMIQNKKMDEVKEIYSKYNIDISSLDTPEKVATFIYAMTEAGYTMNKLIDTKLEELDYKNINNIIDTLKNCISKLYLVERYYKSDDIKDGYFVWLKSLSDSNITINSSGVDVNNKTPIQVLTTSLENLKTLLESTLLKDSGITIKIVTTEDLKNLVDEDGHKVFNKDVDGIRSFVYNDSIYINLNRANVNDMIHETFHILLGALRASDLKSLEGDNPTNNYLDILNFYKHKIPDSIKKKVNDLYSNLAYLDRLEEAVVRYLARTVENNYSFYYNTMDEATSLIIQQFMNLKTEIRNNLDKTFESDLEFQSPAKTIEKGELKENITEKLKQHLEKSIEALVKMHLNTMKTNRIITNVIKTGLENGTILSITPNC